jgi:hypothetical protein
MIVRGMAGYRYPEAMKAGAIGFVCIAAVFVIIVAVAAFILSSLTSGIDNAKAQEDARHGNDGVAFSIAMIFLIMLAVGFGAYMVTSLVIAVVIGIISISLSIKIIASIREADEATRSAWIVMSLLKAVSTLLIGIWLLISGESIISPPIFAVAVLVMALIADIGMTGFVSMASGRLYGKSALRKKSAVLP